MGTKAIQLQLANGTNNIIVNSEPIIFNDIIYTNNTIQYDSETGIITLSDAGIYYIDWWITAVSALTTEYIKFAIKVIGEGAKEIVGNSINKLGQIGGNGVVEVTTTPVQIKLINVTTRFDLPVDVELVNKEQVQANLVLFNNFEQPLGFDAYNIWEFSGIYGSLGIFDCKFGPSKLSPGRITTVTNNESNILIGETGMYEINCSIGVIAQSSDILIGESFFMRLLVNNTIVGDVFFCVPIIYKEDVQHYFVGAASRLTELQKGDIVNIHGSPWIDAPLAENLYFKGEISLFKIVD